MARSGMDPKEQLVYVRPEVLKKQVELVLLAWGMTPEKVDIIADLLVETDLRGIDRTAPRCCRYMTRCDGKAD